MLELLDLSGFAPNASQYGFSASLSSFATATSVQLAGWNIISPYFSTNNFAVSSGNYIVPVNGLYEIEATINYITDVALSVSLPTNVNPFFQVRRTSPTSLNLISGLMPMVDISVTLLTLRGVLGNGAVTLSGVTQLTANDVINLYYDSNSMTIALTLQNIVFSAYPISLQ